MQSPNQGPAISEIRVRFYLDPALFPNGAYISDLSSRLTSAIDQSLQKLGLPARSVVDPYEAPTEKDTNERQLLYLFVQEQRLFFSSDLYAQAYHLVTKTHLDWGMQGERLRNAIGVLPITQQVEFLFLVIREVLHQQPQSLLSTEIAVTYRAQFAREEQRELPEVKDLSQILRDVLRMHLSVADRGAVADVLIEGRQQGKTLPAITEHLIARLRPNRITMELPRALLEEMTQNATPADKNAFALLRDVLFYELGLRFPALHWSINDDLAPGTFRFWVNDLPVMGWRGLSAGEILVYGNRDDLAHLGSVKGTSGSPVNRKSFSVILVSAGVQAQQAGYITYTPFGYLILALGVTLRRYAGFFIDTTVLESILKGLSDFYPELVRLIDPNETSQITKMLRLLLDEEISILNMSRILQDVLDFDTIPVDENEFVSFDPRLAVPPKTAKEETRNSANLLAFVRTTLKSYVSYKYTAGQGTLVVYLLDPQLEKQLMSDGQKSLATHIDQVASNLRQPILTSLRNKIANHLVEGEFFSVLTTSSVRPVFRALIADEFPQLPVLAYQELTPELNIQPIDRISIA